MTGMGPTRYYTTSWNFRIMIKSNSGSGLFSVPWSGSSGVGGGGGGGGCDGQVHDVLIEKYIKYSTVEV